MRYLEGGEISVDELKGALRRAVLANKAYPVFCGSSLRNKGVQILLDAVIDYLPSPADVTSVRGAESGQRRCQRSSSRLRDDAPLSALVFKIVTDPYVGRLAYFRVYSGVISQGQMVMNSTKGKRERIGRLIRMYADRREDIEEVRAGDIGAALGFKDTFTGDTLCDNKLIVLENISFPEPVISIAIEPKSTADQEKMGEALRKLSEEDPDIPGSVGRQHRADDHLRDGRAASGYPHRSHAARSSACRPMSVHLASLIANSITRAVPEVNHKYAKQSGGRGMYGHVVISLEPGDRGSGVIFENDIVGGTVPREYIPAVEKGVREAADSGVIAGYPVTDLKVTSLRWLISRGRLK